VWRINHSWPINEISNDTADHRHVRGADFY